MTAFGRRAPLGSAGDEGADISRMMRFAMNFHAKPGCSSRRTRLSLPVVIAVTLLAIPMISCTKKETIPESQTTTTTTSTVTVSRVDLGRELAADRRVITWNNTFQPADT